MKIQRIAIAVAASMIAVSGCSNSTDTKQASGDETVKLDPACPATAKTDAVPERVVTMDAGAAAILIELGQRDKIVGTAAPDFIKDYSGDLRKELESIPVIDKRQGNTEAVLKTKPDLATSISAMSFGKFPGTPTVDVLAKNDVAAIAPCNAVKDGPQDDIDSSYRYIESLAKTFDVADKGDKLVEQLKAEAQEAKGSDKKAKVLMLSQMSGGGSGIMTNGGSSFATGLVSLAGGDNIAANQNKDFVELSAETIAKDDPEVIVVVSGFSPKSDADLKAAALKNPLLASTTAVKNKNVIVVPQRILLSPSLLNAKAIESIAQAIERA